MLFFILILIIAAAAALAQSPVAGAWAECQRRAGALAEKVVLVWNAWCFFPW